jgi:hypothetical protein
LIRQVPALERLVRADPEFAALLGRLVETFGVLEPVEQTETVVPVLETEFSDKRRR